MSTEETIAFSNEEAQAKATTEQQWQGIWKPGEAKKVWGYRKKEDGTIRIYSVKNPFLGHFSDGIFRVPVKIGNTAVSEYGGGRDPYEASGGWPECFRAELPEGLTALGKNAFRYYPELQTIFLPASLESIAPMALSNKQTIEVAEGNPFFYIQNNCLCHRDGRLIICISRNSQAAAIPDGVKAIEKGALQSCPPWGSSVRLTEVELPESVEIIRKGAFYCVRCSGHLTVTVLSSSVEFEEGWLGDYNCLTLRGWPGSTTEVYAREHKLSFEAL